MQQLPPDTFLQGGKYQIEKALGQGSFGITYLARHTNLGKKLAIKEFFMRDLNSRGEDGSITGMSDSSLSYNYCQKFKKEAINLSNLEHPNIVKVTDSFAENGTFYYVMDYIDGQNLNDYIKTHNIGEAEAVDIIKCVADALIYMHETHRMLHLDMKPGNIMRRDSDGHIFLIDFGLSKHFDKNGEPESSTNIGLGTAGYAPIEQGDSTKSGEFRPTIDVYALGATLYKLLTGETPPNASTLVSDSRLIENNLRRKGVSTYLIDAIVAAMKPSVYERTQTIRAFKEMLSCKPDDEATLVKPVGVTEVVTSTSKSKNEEKEHSTKDWKNIIIAVCILAVVACGAVLFSNGRSYDVETEAVLPDSVNNQRMTINGNLCYYTGTVTYDGATAIADGNGEATFSNGCYYKGPFSNGLMHGNDAYYKYANGDVFQGSFVNNLFTEGTYTVKETGEYYTGTFDNQGLPKKGTWYDKDGKVLERI